MGEQHTLHVFGLEEEAHVTGEATQKVENMDTRHTEALPQPGFKPRTLLV